MINPTFALISLSINLGIDLSALSKFFKKWLNRKRITMEVEVGKVEDSPLTIKITNRTGDVLVINTLVLQVQAEVRMFRPPSLGGLVPDGGGRKGENSSTHEPSVYESSFFKPWDWDIDPDDKNIVTGERNSKTGHLEVQNNSYSLVKIDLRELASIPISMEKDAFADVYSASAIIKATYIDPPRWTARKIPGGRGVGSFLRTRRESA